MQSTVRRERLEKMLLLTILGCLEGVKSGAVMIDEAEKIIFSPYIIKKLRSKKCNEKIVEIVEKGCELEDIYSLLPENFDNVIEELKQETVMLAKDYEECVERFWLEEYLG